MRLHSTLSTGLTGLLFACGILCAGAQQGVAKPALSAPPAAEPQPSATEATPAAVTPIVNPAAVNQAGMGTGTDAPGTAAQPMPPMASMTPSEYQIGPEDAIQVTVWKEPTLSSALAVRPDGMISLPLLGDLRAAGMTPMALSSDITTRLKKYINDPNVTVTVMTFNSKRIFVLGEVQHVGPLALGPGMTPLQAVSAAGGLTPFANKRKIYILRGVEGKQKKVAFDYKKALTSGDMQGVSLAPGDTIVVP